MADDDSHESEGEPVSSEDDAWSGESGEWDDDDFEDVFGPRNDDVVAISDSNDGEDCIEPHAVSEPGPSVQKEARASSYRHSEPCRPNLDDGIAFGDRPVGLISPASVLEPNLDVNRALTAHEHTLDIIDPASTQS